MQCVYDKEKDVEEWMGEMNRGKERTKIEALDRLPEP